jgi:hypothetical protein
MIINELGKTGREDSALNLGDVPEFACMRKIRRPLSLR